MRKKLKFIGVTLIAFGLLFSSWNIYKWWEGSQSVKAIESKSMVINPKKKPDMGNKGVQKKTDIFERFSTLNNDYTKGNKVAKLSISKIDSNFEVFWGTDHNTLGKGVGMYVSKWTTTPNPIGGHTVLSGHRETVFQKLGELEKDDQLTLEFQGEVYSYMISKIWITDADDRTVIVRKKQPTLTLTTCYPFDYIGNAPKRYIIESELIK